MLRPLAFRPWTIKKKANPRFFYLPLYWNLAKIYKYEMYNCLATGDTSGPRCDGLGVGGLGYVVVVCGAPSSPYVVPLLM